MGKKKKKNPGEHLVHPACFASGARLPKGDTTNPRSDGELEAEWSPRILTALQRTFPTMLPGLLDGEAAQKG